MTGARSTRAKNLRDSLARPGLRLMPCCFDALSARLIERAGYEFSFLSGFSAAAVNGLPDTGLMSYEEVRKQLETITEASTLPIICDGDTGYGNAINVKRTVRGFAAAGAAGVMIEDQVAPKRCGHTRGKAVVDFDEAVTRIEAAVDAREESGSDVVIVARTDAAATHGFDEAIRRAQKFRELGADVLFVEAPRTVETMQRFCDEVEGYKLSNMLEQGDTPILAPDRLEAMGFKIAAYPLTLLSASIKAMEEALTRLKRGNPAEVQHLLKDFAQVREIVGFDDYYKEEERYKIDR